MTTATRTKTAEKSSFSELFYAYNYMVGLAFVRYARRFFRGLGRLFRRLFAPLLRRMRLRRRWLRHRRYLFRQRLKSGREELRRAGKEGNPFKRIGVFFRLAFRAVRRYDASLHFVWRLVGPALALAVLAITVGVWSHTAFCLSLTYAGQELGYIENTDVYDRAAAMARGRVVNVNNSFSVEEVPTVAIAVQRAEPLLDDGALCDAILGTAGDAITEASGLYVDGQFAGAMDSASALEGLLNTIKSAYYDNTDPDQRAEFVQDVYTVDGLFPTETVVDATALKTRLTAQEVAEKSYTVQSGDTIIAIAVKNNMTTAELRRMNPAIADTDTVFAGQQLVVQQPQSFLQVKMVKTIRYAEDIEYKTQTVYNADKPVTYSKVKTRGVKGSQDVVAEITYMDGTEVSRKVISTTVTKQPVTQVEEQGTKKVRSVDGTEVEVGDGITTGSMTWPVPICHNMSRGFRRGHYGIDICNGPVTVRGKAAVAADGGRVIYASTGWNGGYGNVIKIQHSNGLITVYAHLQTIKVVQGQTVSRGQTIALIGSTGSSSGPHLHFEVIKNGARVNPLNYVKP